MKSTFFLLISLAVISAPLTVSAIGVSAAPPTLSIRTSAGMEGTARFTVSNPSSEVGLFEAYPEEFEKRITLVPSRFVLEAGEKREVLVRGTGREEGVVRTAIAVEAHPLGVPEQGIGGGVRLPISLEISARGGLFAAVPLSGARALVWLALGALTALLLIRRVSLSTLKRLARSSTLKN